MYVEGAGVHSSQIYTGFGLLEQKGLVKLRFKKGRHFRPLRGIVVAEIDKRYNVVYDLADNPLTVMDDYYPQCDVYFKRMAQEGMMSQYPKIRPLGFNYGVFHHTDHFIKRALLTGNREAILKAILSKNKLIAKALNIKLVATSSDLKEMEALPLHSEHPKIIFMARLWNDATGDPVKDKERKEINQQRIDIVRSMRQEFGDAFIGGIEDGPLAQERCADLILLKDAAKKGSYINTLKGASICIATPGLEASVGFKMAEYICLSKAIVTTPVNCIVPGQFKEGEHYLEYETADQCLEQTRRLMNDAALRSRMMENNHRYYQEYLRPDRLIWNSIMNVMGK